MAIAAVRFGLAALGLGLLSFLGLFVATGGIGPCATDGQMTALLLGVAGTGIGGLVCLVSLPIVLIRKYKARGVGSTLSISNR
jgi:hypothetical protein